MTKKQAQDELRLLRDRASSCLESGKRKEAALCYEKLTLLEPASGDWPRRAADCYGELGRAADQRRFLLVALRAYGKSGQVLKAIAMGKLVLRIFPGDAEATRDLELIEAPAPPPRLGRSGPLPMHFKPPGAPTKPVVTQPTRALAAERRPGKQEESPPSDPPSRRASVRPEAPPPSSRLTPGSPPLLSILPAFASLSPDSILTLGAPPDPPGVVSLDADDLVSLDSRESLDSSDLVSMTPEAGAATTSRHATAFDALSAARLFSSLDVAQRVRLVETVELVTLTAGEVLFEQGSVATAMYVVVEGEVTARVATSAPGGTLELTTLGAGEFFGEIGLLGDQPRQATIVAKADVTLLAFGREAMAALVERDEVFRHAILRFLRQRLVETLMLTSHLFLPFGPEDRAALERLFRFVEVAEGTAMLEEGKKADGLYVLVAGEAVVRRTSGGEDLLLGTLGPGDVFGEMSLLNQRPAMASVLSRTRCYALRLPDRYFMEVLMTHPVLMEHIATLGATRAEQNAVLLSPPSSLQDAHVTLF